MNALLHAWMHLACLRWVGAAFCVRADITATASASEVAQPKDRVWGFEQNSPPCVKSFTLVTPEQPTGISPALPETASGPPNAAEGAGVARVERGVTVQG